MKTPPAPNFADTMHIDIRPHELKMVAPRAAITSRVSPRRRQGATRCATEPAATDELKYEQLLNCLYEGALITSLDGVVRRANDRAGEFFHADPAELETMNVLDLLYDSGDDLLESVRQSLAEERFAVIHAYCVRVDDSMFPAEIAVNGLHFEEPLLCFTIRDVTDRMLAENRLIIEHEAVENAANGIAIADLSGRLHYVNGAVLRMWGFADKAAMVDRHMREFWSEAGTVDGIVEQVVERSGMWFGELSAVKRNGTGMEVLVSVTRICDSDEHLMGIVFSLVDISERKQTERELQEHREHLEDIVADRTREIWETQLEILYRLGQAVEFRNPDVGLHIVRMNHYCAELARLAGMAVERRELLRLASSMHDVGKLGISDSILLKPGPLTRDEFSVMKTHTSIGAQLLSGIDSQVLNLARSVAMTHHEKWDGTGYPDGLAGEDIPLEGRIVAICDVFDALTSDRVYKRAWTVDEAIEELINQKGLHFDPQLVDLFIDNLPGILAAGEAPGRE